MSEFFVRLFGLAERAVLALEMIALAQQAMAHSQAVAVARKQRRRAEKPAEPTP